MGVVIPLQARLEQRREELKQPAWSKFNDPNEVDAFHEYVQSSDAWHSDGYWETLYEGYPYLPPNAPVRTDLTWYVSNEVQGFGVWVLNLSDKPIEVNQGHFGWNSLVRKSTAPPFEPINVMDVEKRKKIAWVVDSQGCGQYGMVMEDGYVWLPSPRPDLWVDPENSM
jgi:hypothetical protein